MENANYKVWIAFYQEFANKLLVYKDNRSQLIEIIKQVYENTGIKLPTLEKDNNITDIDPFTVFGLFNKSIKLENRIAIITELAYKFGVKSQVPHEFDSLPVLNPLASTFYRFIDEREENDINKLWIMFEKAIKYADVSNEDSKNKFINVFNDVAKQKGIKWNITMGLFWIRPYFYLNLDGQSRAFLANTENKLSSITAISPKVLKGEVPNGEDYLAMCEECKRLFTEPEYEFSNFPEMSHCAWLNKENSTGNLEKEFRDYLETCINSNGKNYEKTTINAYCYALKSTATKLKLTPPVKKTNIFDYTDLNEFNDNYKRILDAPNLQEAILESGNGAFKKALQLYSEFLSKRDNNDENKDLGEELADMKTTNIDKNTILYGPPGTGKTYSTVLYAVAIIENSSFDKVKNEEYVEVIKRYNQYKADGLIEFTTFHQSFAYEEFIEGIKPVLQNNEVSEADIKYDIVSGVFKAFCDKSELPVSKTVNIPFEIGKNPTVWKVSLEGTGDNPTREECLKNGHIRIGYDVYGETINDDTDFSIEGGQRILNWFYNDMQIGDIVMSCYSSKTVDAIGVITGEAEWDGHRNYQHYKRLRKVNWLVKGINANIYEMNNNKNMSNPTVHRLAISVNDVLGIVKNENANLFANDIKIPNRVFIIDEINRGNISKIFGELITLIEPTKRKGQGEALEVKLPYSMKSFSVPDNVYLIGTMNTADRSIATVDTALRRRFSFKEMQPEPNVLSNIFVDDISISNMLESMNKKISVLYDREHTIGHSFFIPLRKSPTIETLANIFENNTIPLLQEYFYEDYEKIRLVLGDNKKTNIKEQFIASKELDFSELFGDSDISFDEINAYEININAFTNINSYKSI